MRSLVAGPIAIVPLDGETLVVAGGAACWVEGLGLVVIAAAGSTHVGELYIVQLGGQAVRLGGRRGIGGSGWTGFGWAYPDDVPVGWQNVWGFAKMRLPSTALLSSGYTAGLSSGSSFALMPDRLLHAAFGKILATLLAGGASAVETVLDASVVDTAGSVVPADLAGGKSVWWVVFRSSGKVFQYDAIAKAEVAGVRTSLDPGNTVVAYSRKHDLFVTIRAGSLYVYANEPVAASITAPQFSAAPARGGVRTLRARVLGDLGEPCVGRVVGFAVTNGALERAAVQTDAAGWASTTHRAPLSTASGATATATLVE